MEKLEIDSLLSVVNIAQLVAKCAQQKERANGSDLDHFILEVQALLWDKLSVRADAKADLFQTGVFDSMTLVQLILHLEERFGFHLSMEDLDIDHLRSVTKIAELVASRPLQRSASRG